MKAKSKARGGDFLAKYRAKAAIRKLFGALDAAGIDAARVRLNKDGEMDVIDGNEAALDDLMETIQGIPGMQDALDAAMAAENKPENKSTETETENRCKRTACQAEHPTWRHTQTGDLYCVSCARRINEHHPGLVVEEDYEMQAMRRAASRGDAGAKKMLDRLAQMPAVAREIREMQ